MLNTEPRIWPQNVSGAGCVLRCDKIRMGALGSVTRKRQHVGTKGGKNYILFRHLNTELCGFHRIEVSAHGSYWLTVAMAAKTLHNGNMRDAQSQNEAVTEQPIQGVVPGHRSDGVSRINVGDAACHAQPIGLRQSKASEAEGLETDPLRIPQSVKI